MIKSLHAIDAVAVLRQAVVPMRQVETAWALIEAPAVLDRPGKNK